MKYFCFAVVGFWLSFASAQDNADRCPGWRCSTAPVGVCPNEHWPSRHLWIGPTGATSHACVAFDIPERDLPRIPFRLEVEMGESLTERIRSEHRVSEACALEIQRVAQTFTSCTKGEPGRCAGPVDPSRLSRGCGAEWITSRARALGIITYPLNCRRNADEPVLRINLPEPRRIDGRNVAVVEIHTESCEVTALTRVEPNAQAHVLCPQGVPFEQCRRRLDYFTVEEIFHVSNEIRNRLARRRRGPEGRAPIPANVQSPAGTTGP